MISYFKVLYSVILNIQAAIRFHILQTETIERLIFQYNNEYENDI